MVYIAGASQISWTRKSDKEQSVLLPVAPQSVGCVNLIIIPISLPDYSGIQILHFLPTLVFLHSFLSWYIATADFCVYITTEEGAPSPFCTKEQNDNFRGP